MVAVFGTWRQTYCMWSSGPVRCLDGRLRSRSRRHLPGPGRESRERSRSTASPLASRVRSTGSPSLRPSPWARPPAILRPTPRSSVFSPRASFRLSLSPPSDRWRFFHLELGAGILDRLRPDPTAWRIVRRLAGKSKTAGGLGRDGVVALVLFLLIAVWSPDHVSRGEGADACPIRPIRSWSTAFHVRSRRRDRTGGDRQLRGRAGASREETVSSARRAALPGARRRRPPRAGSSRS